MKRLIAVLTILTFVGTWVVVPIASAQQSDPRLIGGTSNDPGRPSALEGSYITGNGQFQWLMVGAPRGCINSDPVACPQNDAHLWFYNESCNRVVDKASPLTENDVRVFPLHSPGFLSSPRIGNVLVAAVSPFESLAQPVLATNAIIGEMFYVDINRGIGRMEEMAALKGPAGWQPYSGAHVILWAPPDDGTFFFNTLLVRCPVGGSVTAQGTVFGTAGTLAGDMIDLQNQDEGGGAPGEGYSAATSGSFSLVTTSSAYDESGRFAKALSAFVYNVDEEFQESVDNLPCRCIGVDPNRGAPVSWQPEVRMSALSAFSATNESYWELESFASDGLDDVWAASLNVRLVIGTALNVNFFGRLHRAPGKAGLEAANP
jgi:hypothetical protein